MAIEATSLLDDFVAWATPDEDADESPQCGVNDFGDLCGVPSCPLCSHAGPDLWTDMVVTSSAFRLFLDRRGLEDVDHGGVDLRLRCRELMRCFCDHPQPAMVTSLLLSRREDPLCSHLTLSFAFNPECPIEYVVKTLEDVSKGHLDVLEVDPERLSSRLQEALESISSIRGGGRTRRLVRGDGGPPRRATMTDSDTSITYVVSGTATSDTFTTEPLIHAGTSVPYVGMSTSVEWDVVTELSRIQDAYERDYYSKVRLARTVALMTRMLPAHAAFRDGGAGAFMDHILPLDGQYAEELRSEFILRCTDAVDVIGNTFGNIAPYELHLLHSAGARPEDLPQEREPHFSSDGIRTIRDVMTIVPPEDRDWLWEGMVEFCERMDEVGPHHRRTSPQFPDSARVIRIMEEVGCRSLMYLGIGCDPRVMDTESSLLMSKLMAEGRWEEWCEGRSTLDGYFPEYIGGFAWPDPLVMRRLLDHFGGLEVSATLAEVAEVAFDVRLDDHGRIAATRDQRLRLHHGTSDHRLYSGCPFNPEFGPIVEEGLMTPAAMKSSDYESRSDGLGEVYLAMNPQTAVEYAKRSVGQDARMGIQSKPVILVADVSLLAARASLSLADEPGWPRRLQAPVADCLTVMYQRWPQSPPDVVTLPYLPKSLIVGELELHEVESEDEDDCDKAAVPAVYKSIKKRVAKFIPRRAALL